MTQRIVRDEKDRERLLTFLRGLKTPFTVTIARGKNRSIDQNRLNRLWCNEIAEQLGDRTAEEVRGELKLRFAIPILRAENDDFAEKYDRIIKNLPYETKLELMQMPIDLPATRLMTTPQFTRYLDEVYRFYSGQGIVLTEPPDKQFGPKQGTRET
jgi:hypothetical protein